ncbi:MAG: MATE family efflux transporter [Ruminococcaceae bacterium]|nr:MATE family efflux transporter [Oscillospiraceae bacterium]
MPTSSSANAKKVRDLTEGALLPQILMFVLPLIATSVLQLLFNTADTVVVGRWGGSTPEECEISLAAVGSCGALVNLIINLFMGLSVGAGVCVAHGIGAKQYEDVSRVVHTAVITSLFCGIAVTVIGIAGAETFLTMMGTDPDVVGEASMYMRAYFCGMPACMVYNYCATMLRSAGDTVRPLGFLSVAGVVNVVLNLIMVLVFRLGAVGVGIATAASQWVSCILIVIFMMGTDGVCKIELSKMKVDKAKLKRIIFLGLPAGLQSSLFSISNVLIQTSVNSFGKVFVAGATAASNLDGYVYVSQNALYHAALTFVGQNLGAKKYDRLIRVVVLCTVVVTVVGVLLGSGVCFFGETLLKIFIPENPEAIEYGMIRLAFVCGTYFLCGLMEVGSGVMRGMGKAVTPMIVSLLGSCALRIVWIYTVFAMYPTPEILYLSYPVTWIITSLAHYIMCFFTIRKSRREDAIANKRVLN